MFRPSYAPDSSSMASSTLSTKTPSRSSTNFPPVVPSYNMSAPCQAGNTAPLPSPTTQATTQSQYFSPLQSQSQASQAEAQIHLQQQLEEQRRREEAQRQAAAAHLNHVHAQQRSDSDSSSSSETSLHLQNFTLLAAAAERAQFDCTMRDMEEMNL